MVAYSLSSTRRIVLVAAILALLASAQVVTNRLSLRPSADGSFSGIQGSTISDGNILLQPGPIATHSSVYVLSTRLDTPGFVVRDYTGTTTSNSFELQTNAGTTFFKVIGGTDAGAPGTVVTKDVVPFLDATYKLGNTTHSYDAHLNNTVVYGAYIRPSTTGGANLGSSPLHFATAWINDIQGSTATFASTLTTANVFPSANLTYNLGASGSAYASTWSQKVTFPNAGGNVVLDNPSGAQLSMTGGGLVISGTDTNNVPTLTLTNTTGGTGVAWVWASKNDGSVSLNGGGTIRQEFDPANTDWIFRANLVHATTQTLGTSSKRWTKLWVTDIDCSGTCPGASPFTDATAILYDNSDPTKLLRFELGGLTTANTRILTPQNASYTLAGLDTPSQIANGLAILTDSGSPSLGMRIYGEQSKELFTAESYGTTVFPGFYAASSRGTLASPSAVLSGNKLGIFAAGGYDGSALQRAQGYVSIVSSGNWSGSSTPTQINFTTTVSGSTTPILRWSVLETGDLLPGADNAYRIGYTTSQVSEFYNVSQFISGTMTFTNGSGNVTLANSAGSLTVTGGIHFANEVNADNGITVANGKSYHCVGACNVGSTTQHVSTIWVDAITANSNAGLSTTKTIRNAAGTGTCTLIYDAGILTGGTC